MKILSVKTENIMRCKLAEVAFNGDVVVIGGNNAQGKSSFAKSIWMAFGGKDAIPDEPVTEGAAFGTIDIELDGFLLSRRIYPNRDTVLELRSAEGAKFASPQKMLDAFNLKFGFHPQSFLMLKPKDQVDTLRGVLGLDFAELDQQAAAVYQSRADVGRSLKLRQGARASLGEVVPGLPDEEILVEELMDKCRIAREAIAEHQRGIDWQERVIGECQGLRDNIAEMQSSIAQMQAELELKSKKLDWHKEKMSSVVLPDLSAAESELKSIGAKNQAIRQNKERLELDRLIEDMSFEYKSCTDALSRFEEEKKQAIAAAPLPIEGLGFDERGVTYKGKPLEQASSAEQWEVAVAIGFALNPKLRLVYLEYGSLLDAATIQRVCQLVHDKGGQAIIELVGNGDNDLPTVLFEDGVGTLKV